MKLRWVQRYDYAWFAYSGSLHVAMVVHRDDGTFHYNVDAVRMKWIGKGYGDTSSIKTAKRAVERAWRQWLEAAGLAGA